MGDKWNRASKRWLCAALGAVLFAQCVFVLVRNFTGFANSGNREYIWVGGVRAEQDSGIAAFRVRAPGGSQRTVVVATDEKLANKVFEQSVQLPQGDFEAASLSVTTLKPKTKYFYASLNGEEILARGTFSTPANENERFSFRIATAGCALTGSQHQVYQDILSFKPFMMLHAGDFHYGDLNDAGIDERVDAIDRVMHGSARELYTATAMAYMYDDHDYCANNKNADCPGRELARKAYQKAFPHYNLSAAPDADGLADVALYQAFTIGTVRFILTDLRSEAVLSTADFPGKMYSDEQRAWLYREISTHDKFDFVVWLSSKPWIGSAEVGGDSWQGFAQDREELSRFIAEEVGTKKRNLFVISSDAHMVAFDDGRNTQYTTEENGDARFPILQSGPLRNIGSTKGGPFSDGCHTYIAEMNSQFSIIDFEIADEGEPCISYASYRSQGGQLSTILKGKICGFTFYNGTDTGGTCNQAYFTSATMGVFITGGCLFILTASIAIFSFPNNRKFVLHSVLIALFSIFVSVCLTFLPFAFYHTVMFYNVETLGLAIVVLVLTLCLALFLIQVRLLSSKESGETSPSESGGPSIIEMNG